MKQRFMKTGWVLLAGLCVMGIGLSVLLFPISWLVWIVTGVVMPQWLSEKFDYILDEGFYN